jgi:hypothetical protein
MDFGNWSLFLSQYFQVVLPVLQTSVRRLENQQIEQNTVSIRMEEVLRSDDDVLVSDCVTIVFTVALTKFSGGASCNASDLKNVHLQLLSICTVGETFAGTLLSNLKDCDLLREFRL